MQIMCIFLSHPDTLVRQSKSQESGTNTSAGPINVGQCMSGSNSAQNHVGSQIGQDDAPSASMKSGPDETCKSEGTQAGGTLQQQQQQQQSTTKSTSTGTGTRNKDYMDDSVIITYYFNIEYFKKICFSSIHRIVIHTKCITI